MAERIFGFEPFVPPESTILILGSMPSVKSLEQGFYYANKQNRMFKLIAWYYARLQGKELELDLADYGTLLPSVKDRQRALSALGIALWDVLDSCERQGSLDSNIKNAHYSDIIGLLEAYPKIKTIITNGGFAAKHFARSTLKDERYLAGKVSFELFNLPSTSAANTIKLELLKERYDQVLLPLLNLSWGHGDAIEMLSRFRGYQLGFSYGPNEPECASQGAGHWALL